MVECANCGRTYRSYLTRNALWCPKDRALFCQKCVGRAGACRECGTQLSILPELLLLLGVIFSLVVGILVLTFVPSDVQTFQQNAEATVPVSHLAPGGTSKVFGTVSAGQGSVIVVFQYTSDGQPATGRHVHDFWLNDSTGRVLVLMGSNDSTTPSIGSGGVPFPSTGVPTGFQYESGDPIAVIGTVGHVGNETTLAATAVAGGPGGFARHSPAYVALEFGVPATICAITIVVGVAIQYGRLRENARNGPSFAARRPKPFDAAPGGEPVRWVDNPELDRVRRQSIVVNSTSAAIGGLIAATFLEPYPLPLSVVFVVFFVAPFVLLFALIWGLIARPRVKFGVRRLGFAPSGMYFDYARPKKGAPTYLAWSDVQSLDAPSSLNQTVATLDTPRGHEVLLNIDPPLLQTLVREFEAGRGPPRGRSASVPSAGALLPDARVPPTAANFRWQTNLTRRRTMYRARLWLVAEVPAIVALLLLVPRFGSNQGGDVLFFFPAAWGATLLFSAYRAPTEFGLSATGFSVREPQRDRSVLWSDIAELTPLSAGVRYTTYAGLESVVTQLDRAFVEGVVRGVLESRGRRYDDPARLRPSETAWSANPVRRRAWALFVAFVGGPAVVISSVFLIVTLDPKTIVEGGVDVAVAVFGGEGIAFLVPLLGAPPAILIPHCPRRVAVDADGLYLEWSTRGNLGNLAAVGWDDIASVNAGSTEESRIAGWFRIRSVPLTIRTVGGLVLSGGLVSPSFAQQVRTHLRSDQLVDWDRSQSAPTARPHPR